MEYFKLMLNDVEIGYISYTIYPKQKSMHITKVSVIEQYQNRGVAKILIEGLLRKAKNEGIETLSHTEFTDDGEKYIKEYQKNKCNEHGIKIEGIDNKRW